MTTAGVHIQTSRDGRFVYASNRGANSMQVYAADEQTGKLTEVQRISATGNTPWDFALDPTGRWLLVANNASNSINVFAVDPARRGCRSISRPMSHSCERPSREFVVA